MPKTLPLTRKDIQELANSSSFTKGVDYYKGGEVKNLIRNDNHFEGKVRGSRNYHVTLDIEDNELDFDCNCPYDYDGICKHCVALGLAILNGEFSENNEIKKTTAIVTKEVFNQCFSETDTQKKLN